LWLALKRRMFGYLLKPFLFEDVEDMVGRALREKNKKVQ
jgi:DNA-binding NtrC family response regulator